MADYNNFPVLSKIKIGNKDYWLKDADARALLNTVKGDLAQEITNRIAADTQVLADAKEYADDLVGSAIKIKFEIVTELPTADEAHSFNKNRTIYLKAKQGKTGDVYEEYICIKPEGKTAYEWEMIGSTAIDLSGYVTKTEYNAKVAELEAADAALDDRLDVVEAKPAMGIQTSDITAWNAEKGAKAAVNAEQDRATAAEEGLNAELEDLTDRVEDIEDKEDGWDAKLDNVKLGDSFLEVKSDVAGKGNYVDLGNIATTSGVLDNASYTDASHKLVIHKGNGDNVVEHTFGALADKSSASGTVDGQTIKNVKATGSLSGSATVTLGFDSTAINSQGSYKPAGSVTGNVTAAGSVTVELKDANVLSGVKTAGVLPTYTHTGFSGGNLGSATKEEFCYEGMICTPEAIDPKEEEPQDFCLVITNAAKKNAVVEQGAYTQAVYGTDNFTQGSMPEFNTATVGIKSAAFQGSEVAIDAEFAGTSATISVSGNYDKAKVNSASIAINDAELAVGDIVVAAKTVTVE